MLKRTIFFFLLVILSYSCSRKNDEIPHAQPTKGEIVKKFVKIPKARRIKGRFEQEIEMTADPTTGKIPKNRLAEPMQKLAEELKLPPQQRSAIGNITWEERGPNNIGGRTRAIMFDPNDNTNKKVWAGSVAGGLWYTNDITASNIQWTKVDDFWNNLAISGIAYDPTNTQIYYASTGEAYGNFDSVRGDGIWKSINGGATWAQLASTTSLPDITQIEVLQNGTIIAGNRISTNQGNSWSTIKDNNNNNLSVASISIAGNNDIYIGGFSGQIYRSQNNGVAFTLMRDTTGNRVEIASSKSDPNIIYAMCYKSNGNQDIHWFQRSDDNGQNWTTNLSVPGYPGCSPNPTTHFTRSQGWYDLTMVIHPTDPNKLVVGGVDCHASSDGGQSWSGISNWYTCFGVDYVHADIHEFKIRSGVNNSLLVGCDGGVFYSEDIYPSSGSPDFQFRSQNYNVTQFYHGDIHPGEGVDYLLAGAQDNGTQRIDASGIDDTDEITGGDGAYTHIDQDQPNIQISAYVYNYYWISTNSFQNYENVSIGNNNGSFINPTDYDSKMNVLYGVASGSNFSYIKNIGGISLESGTTSLSLLNGTGDCVKVSPNITNRVYIGNGNRLVRIDNAHSSSPTETLFTTPRNAYMSSVDIEIGNEDHIIVSYSNYGGSKVYESTNGGANWSDIDGDLPNMPVRSAIFNPNNPDQAILATELGVWTTDDIDGTSTDWGPSNTGLANVRTDMVRYRASDNEMIAATHGRGVFTTSSFDCQDPDGCFPATCRIGDVGLIGNVLCNSIDSTYTANISIEIFNSPASGMLDVNGSLYSIIFNEPNQTVNIAFAGENTGQSIDLMIKLTDTDCEVFRPLVFVTPSPGCSGGTVCQGAITLDNPGTYTVPNLASGNGANNPNANDAYWYKFTPDCDGTISISSCGYGIDTRLWLYSGSSCSNLNNVANNDDICEMSPGDDAYASLLENIPIIAGTQYFIEWDDRWSNSGFDWDLSFTTSDVLFVDKNVIGSNHTGCNWANALTSLTEAISIISENPNKSTLWIKEGTYTTEGERNFTFTLSGDTKLYGGFDGTETSLAERDIAGNPTILSGDIGILGDSTDNSYRILDISSQATEVIVDGFTIEEANADQVSSNDKGAGLNNNGTATISNCTIRNCQSLTSGPAIYNENPNGNLSLENVIFINNVALDGSPSVFNSTQANMDINGVVILEN